MSSPLHRLAQDESRCSSWPSSTALGYYMACAACKNMEGAGIMIPCFMTLASLPNGGGQGKYGKPMHLAGLPGMRFLNYGRSKEGSGRCGHHDRAARGAARRAGGPPPQPAAGSAAWSLPGWSSGHAAPHLGAVSVHCMNASYGGKQSIPKTFKIAAHCLGPIRPALKIGDTYRTCACAAQGRLVRS